MQQLRLELAPASDGVLLRLNRGWQIITAFAEIICWPFLHESDEEVHPAVPAPAKCRARNHSQDGQ